MGCVLTQLFYLNSGHKISNFVAIKTNIRMANRNVILLHILESDTYEFYGSPASLFDKHEAHELLIAQTSLNNHFSKMAAQGKDLVYRNAYCEIRKGEVYVKPSTRGRKKDNI